MDNKKSSSNYGVCRCCSQEGHHKDLMKEYQSKGIRESYSDMFTECFNLYLSTAAGLTTLICSSCIGQLKDAASFRMLVITTQNQLLQQLEKTKETVFVNVPVEEALSSELDIKMEEVKVEPPGEFDNVDVNSDAQSDFVADVDCFEGFTAASISDYDSEDEACVAVLRERALLSRAPPPPLPTRRALAALCPDYERHLNLLKDIKITPSMLIKYLQDKRDIKRPTRKVYVTEKMSYVVNASVLIENSNLIPFRSKRRAGYPCFYCRHIFDSFPKLKAHTEQHKKSEAIKTLKRYGPECLVLYAEVTDLQCTICNQPTKSLNDLKIHLTKVHKKKMYLDVSDRIIPFKLTEVMYECQVCGCKYETFGSIERHMNVHFRNYICKECGTGFVTKYRMKVHVKSMHVDGNFPCPECGKVFRSLQKHKNHVNTVHKMLKRFKCTMCPERFVEYFRRQKHMVDVHGVAPLKYKCNVCEKEFDRRYTLSRHLKRDHLEERDFQCDVCPYTCFTNNELRVHMIKHNGERIYECAVCKKSYARKKTLKEHMRIHNNDRRFSCDICSQTFVQKCSLKGHLKTHHFEYLPVNVPINTSVYTNRAQHEKL